MTLRQWVDRVIFGRAAAAMLVELERKLAEAEARAERKRVPVDARSEEAMQAVEETVKLMQSGGKTPNPMRATGDHDAVPLPKGPR